MVLWHSSYVSPPGCPLKFQLEFQINNEFFFSISMSQVDKWNQSSFLLNCNWPRFPGEDGLIHPTFLLFPGWTIKGKIETHRHPQASCSLMQRTHLGMNHGTWVHQRPVCGQEPPNKHLNILLLSWHLLSQLPQDAIQYLNTSEGSGSFLNPPPSLSFIVWLQCACPCVKVLYIKPKSTFYDLRKVSPFTFLTLYIPSFLYYTILSILYM